MKTLKQILTQSEEFLARYPFTTPRTDSEWLIGFALDLSRMDLYLQFDRPLDEPELARIRPLLKRRAAGEPVQYIVGKTSFYNCELLVGPGVLVPRPETERLVDVALDRYPGSGDILDLCTGSGAVIFSLAQELDATGDMVAVDSSKTALEWARKNRDYLKLPQVDLLAGDLCAPVAGRRFSMITVNPPYVAENERHTLPADVRDREPSEALFAGTDGLDILRRLAAEGPDFLVPDGWLLTEIGMQQGRAVQALWTAAGLKNITVIQDFGGRDRVVAGQKK